MTCDLTNPIFTNEAAAVAHLESSRWATGLSCPLCGSVKAKKMGGQTQAGMFLCGDCRGKFTVRTGTVFERSHIPLHKWLLATHLMASSKKGISAHQLHRMLGITYKSAWFMAHRIREAMAPAKGEIEPMGGPGKIVEADDTELAPSRKTRVVGGRIRARNKKFLALVERDGKVRSLTIDGGIGNLRKAVRDNLDPASVLHTDGANAFRAILPAGQHESVDHDKMFARDGKTGRVHSNTAEGYFSLFKRGLVGTYQHISPAHLPRYLAEFDFRMNNRTKLGICDAGRAAHILKGAEGKRLTYRQVG